MNERTSHKIETLTIRISMRLRRRGGRQLYGTGGHDAERCRRQAGRDPTGHLVLIPQEDE
jgi:hypothetical protein